MHPRSISSILSESKTFNKQRILILGAGVSAACGFPVTKDLFKDTIRHVSRKDHSFITDMNKFLAYLYPTFNPRYENYPNIESFLNMIDTMTILNERIRNKQLYSNDKLIYLKEQLLILICKYLCSKIDASKMTSLNDFAQSIKEKDIIITFNWDFSLEYVLVNLGYNVNKINGYWYFLEKPQAKLTILKPHGSVDWFDKDKVKLKPDRILYLGKKIYVYSFFKYPAIKRDVMPYILAPVIRKEFETDEIINVWRGVYTSLCRADEIFFLGYSFPNEDLHSRFVFRAAIRTNIIKKEKENKKIKLVVINPDESVILTYRTILGHNFIYHPAKFENLNFKEIMKI